MDEFSLLRFAHLVGLTIMGAGLIGVFACDMRSRNTRDLRLFGQLVSLIAMFYDGVVVPGALILLASGTWLIVEYHDGWAFLDTPWLVGMVALFLFEFVEGNTITRHFFMRLRRQTDAALKTGDWTEELIKTRGEQLASFTHFLDLPMLLVIVSLAVLRPDNWTHFIIGSALAIAVATALNFWIPKAYPWDTKVTPTEKPH